MFSGFCCFAFKLKSLTFDLMWTLLKVKSIDIYDAYYPRMVVKSDGGGFRLYGLPDTIN